MMNHLRGAVLLGLSLTILAEAGSRRKQWDLDLSRFANNQGEMAAQVWGIRFSPDESKVAIGFGPRWNFDSNPRHIVVVALDQPQLALREFDLKPYSPYPSAGSINWSPSGRIIVTRSHPVMFRLDAGTPCAFPEDSEFGGFLSGDRMVIRLPDQREIRILNPDCSVGDEWRVEGHAGVLDTSPVRNLLAIQLFEMDPAHPFHVLRSAIEVIDAATHLVRQSWKDDSVSTTVTQVLFADQGELVCGAKFRSGKRGPEVACWDIATGSMVAENDKVSLDWSGPGINGAGGQLVSLTDYRYTFHGRLWDILDLDPVDIVPRRHLIWNTRTGEELVSWGGDFHQTEVWGRDFGRASKKKTPSVISLSPTGKYVAEGGSGVVSVHTIEPR